MTDAFIRRENGDTETREEGHVRREVSGLVELAVQGL